MKLYKYMSDEAFIRYLDIHLRGEVHLSAWQEFNDPMEGFFSYMEDKDSQRVLEKIIGEKAKYRVSCFCKSYRKFLLWSYYTNKHRGVCLEYSVDKKTLPKGCHLQPIEYTKNLPQFEQAMPVEEQAKRFLLTKMQPWKQEGEIRLLGYELDDNTVPFGRLTGITLGVNFSKGDIDGGTRIRIAEAISRPARFKPKLYQAVIRGSLPEIQREEVETV